MCLSERNTSRVSLHFLAWGRCWVFLLVLGHLERCWSFFGKIPLDYLFPWRNDPSQYYSLCVLARSLSIPCTSQSCSLGLPVLFFSFYLLGLGVWFIFCWLFGAWEGDSVGFVGLGLKLMLVSLVSGWCAGFFVLVVAQGCCSFPLSLCCMLSSWYWVFVVWSLSVFLFVPRLG